MRNLCYNRAMVLVPYFTGGIMKQKREGYKEKIARHRRAFFCRILLIFAVLAGLGLFFYIRYQRYVYKTYDTISSFERETVSGATDVRLGNAILTYSKDGVHCTDAKGKVLWNQTFEIQDVRLAVSGDMVAIGDYNGRSIYVADSEKLLGEITTAMPLRDLTVCEAGYVTAVLADTDITWVNTYGSDGEMKKEGRTHMDDSGYPMAISLSPNGELLCVAYVYMDAGVLRTNIAFYNFGAVGSNVSDHLVSTWAYTDMLIPSVRFLNNSTAVAIGDNRLEIYTGNHVPGSPVGHMYDGEVQSACYDDRYVGLVFFSDRSDGRYRIDIYDTAHPTAKVKKFYFDMDYTDFFFDKGNLVIYNETECLVMTLDGMEKFRGSFAKPVRLMLPTGKAYRYALLTDNSVDTVQLK